jgi:hypothetical protein
MTSTVSSKRTAETIAFVDRIFGAGMGERHVRFLERLDDDTLREMIHGYHVIERDTQWLSLEENYLLGMCTLCTTGHLGTAAMFAKTLMHMGVPKQKLLAAVGRLAMWIGGLPAAEASLCIQKAIREYEREGLASMAVWFPDPKEDA